MRKLADNPDLTEISKALAIAFNKCPEASGDLGIYDSLATRPLTTVYDVAVSLSRHTRDFARFAKDCERILVWSKTTIGSRHLTKLGGAPFCPHDFSWPENMSGEPMLFVGQMYLPYDLQDKLSRLPGDLLLLFNRSQDISVIERTSRMSIAAHDIEMMWIDVADTYACDLFSVASEFPVLPFEFSGSCVRIPTSISFSDERRWFASRLLNRNFCSADYWSEDDLLESAFPGFIPFAQIASLDFGYERSVFFDRSATVCTEIQWPRFDIGPLTFGDLGSLVFFQSTEDSQRILCEAVS